MNNSEKHLAPAEETRLRELLARTDLNDATFPGLTDREAAEIRQLAWGLDPVTAGFITAIERQGREAGRSDF